MVVINIDFGNLEIQIRPRKGHAPAQPPAKPPVTAAKAKARSSNGTPPEPTPPPKKDDPKPPVPTPPRAAEGAEPAKPRFVAIHKIVFPGNCILTPFEEELARIKERHPGTFNGKSGHYAEIIGYGYNVEQPGTVLLRRYKVRNGHIFTTKVIETPGYEEQPMGLWVPAKEGPNPRSGWYSKGKMAQCSMGGSRTRRRHGRRAISRRATSSLCSISRASNGSPIGIPGHADADELRFKGASRWTGNNCSLSLNCAWRQDRSLPTASARSGHSATEAADNQSVPCWRRLRRGNQLWTNRVVFDDGSLGAANAAHGQSAQLQAEGVPFNGQGVDLVQCPPVAL